MYLARVVKSGKPMHLQVAYPFYTVAKTTFLNFCKQVMNNLVTIFLW